LPDLTENIEAESLESLELEIKPIGIRYGECQRSRSSRLRLAGLPGLKKFFPSQ
jgi:hypothetical protein